jgi:hypothetical protein
MPKGMYERKKKKIIDATDHVEAPARVILAEQDNALALQMVGFAQACLNSAVPLLTKNEPMAPQLMNLTATKMRASVVERRKMAIKYLRRNIEICTKAIEGLGGTVQDESNSW